MIRNLFLIVFLLCGYFLISCTATRSVSEEAIATAIAETAIIEEIRAYHKTRTAEAQATNTPFPTSTETPVPTNTVQPSLTPTPTPPPGKAYVPNFIGMAFREVRDVLTEMVWEGWYYIAIVNKEVDGNF